MRVDRIRSAEPLPSRWRRSGPQGVVRPRSGVPVSSTQMFCASRRRSASVVCPTRTTNGSRPGRASARISTARHLRARTPAAVAQVPRAARKRSEPTPMTRPLVPGESAARLTKPGLSASPKGAAAASM